MKAPVAIVLYALAVVALSAAAAPWVFWAVQSGNAQFGHSDWLARQPFRRVFDRTLLVLALAGLWPLLRTVNIKSWRELGFSRTPAWWRQLGLGLMIGVASLLIAGMLDVVIGGPRLGISQPAGKLLKFAMAAVVVAVVEETFFRGGLQGVLQRSMNRHAALILVSTVYAALHFIKPSKVVLPAEAVRWTSGFEHLARAVTGFASTSGNGIVFITLLLVGLILGWAFVRTRALYLPVGLHAGWVFTMKTYAWLGGGNLLQHLAVWPILIAVFLVLRKLCQRL